ncbi:MAG TPA: zinc ribbon domain-containing protein [Gammaproteobacteria bacterium]|jgi:putative FmdB family regulatory protein
MPIYEYECVSCGHKLEAIQKLSDAPLSDCPECEESQLKKLVSAAGFRLKGGGWYETDFKSGSKKNVAETTKPAAPASCGTAGGCPAASD